MGEKKLTIAIMDAPYEKASTTTALRIISAALKKGVHVNVFAYEGAVNLAMRDQPPIEESRSRSVGSDSWQCSELRGKAGMSDRHNRQRLHQAPCQPQRRYRQTEGEGRGRLCCPGRSRRTRHLRQSMHYRSQNHPPHRRGGGFRPARPNLALVNNRRKSHA